VLAIGAPALVEQAQATIAQGVWGYVTREVGASELTHALRKLASGGMYVTDTARRALAGSARELASG
jgi:DNA-binding NarL/FixJ family response regulator